MENPSPCTGDGYGSPLPPSFALLLGWVVLFGHFLLVDNFTCQSCMSSMSEEQWRLGLQPLGYPIFGHDKMPAYRSLPLTAPKQRVKANTAASRLFPRNHRHVWQFRQSSPYYLFGKRWGGCALGPPRQYSPFAYAYLHHSEFPLFVEQLIRAGRIRQERAAELFVFEPRRPEDRRNPLYTDAVAIVLEFSARHPNAMFEETFDRAFRKGVPSLHRKDKSTRDPAS